VDGSLTLIGVELGAAYGGDPDKLHEGVDEGYVALCRERLSHRLPLFADSTMRGGWAGMIMMSPDGRPIIDQIPSVPGLYVMLGDSGTSFKTSPAIGKCLRRGPPLGGRGPLRPRAPHDLPLASSYPLPAGSPAGAGISRSA
jgi:sarcosine oxidase subunit beta